MGRRSSHVPFPPPLSAPWLEGAHIDSATVYDGELKRLLGTFASTWHSIRISSPEASRTFTGFFREVSARLVVVAVFHARQVVFPSSLVFCFLLFPPLFYVPFPRFFHLSFPVFFLFFFSLLFRFPASVLYSFLSFHVYFICFFSILFVCLLSFLTFTLLIFMSGIFVYC